MVDDTYTEATMIRAFALLGSVSVICAWQTLHPPNTRNQQHLSLAANIPRSRFGFALRLSPTHPSAAKQSQVLWGGESTAVKEKTETRSSTFIYQRSKQVFEKGNDNEPSSLVFHYDYELLYLEPSSSKEPVETIGVILVHPIGVGIGKWFYHRLYDKLFEQWSDRENNQRLVVATPDLLGSGSASDPSFLDGSSVARIPLLNITDWSDQIIQMMTEMQSSKVINKRGYSIDRWCFVSNGGCSPIALKAAQKLIEGKVPSNLENSKPPFIVLSSVPGLSYFIRPSDDGPPDLTKVLKSYRTLCGPLGNLFWWYSCRNEGKFIQTFSEKNLVADPASLGPEWRTNCVVTARQNDRKSKYSTFAFLAGTLRDGCEDSLSTIKENKIPIHIIRGRDRRKNRARSWFWQKKRGVKEPSNGDNTRTSYFPQTQNTSDPNNNNNQTGTLWEYLQENNIAGRLEEVGGRISLAYEDAQGYASALLNIVEE